jgi:hypothetical protein
MKPSTIWITCVIAAAVIFFLGRYSVGEKIVHLPTQTDIGPVETPYLPATVDSVQYADLLMQYAELRRQAAARGEDTVFIRDTIRPPVYVTRSRIDTILPTSAQVSVIQDGDSTYIQSSVGVHINAEYLSHPINAFRFHSVDVDPFTVEIPVVERVRENPISGDWLAFEVMGGYRQGGVGMGGEIQIRNIGAGVMLSHQTAPLYFLSLRVPVF